MNNSQNNSGSDRQSTSSQSVGDGRSLSPSSSPRSSPRPSPRPHHRREHSRSDSHLSVGYKEVLSTSPNRSDGFPNISETCSTNGKSSEQIDFSRSVSQESTVSSNVNVNVKDKKEGKGTDRPKKKSSWYNVLYPTYKSRSEDFKRIFKDVPDDERLIVDYSCALQKEILVHGRLYITQNYLCFYANIFGWETTVTLLWKDVTAITKEKTALVIPNAILLCDKNDKYFFTSFTSRDKTYMMLFRVWQNALLDQPMSQQEMWQWVHQCYGEELGLTSDDEDYVSPSACEEQKLSSRSAESLPEVRKRPFFSASIDKILTAKLESNGVLCGVTETIEGMSPNGPADDRQPGHEDATTTGSGHISRSASQEQPTDLSDNTDVSDAERNTSCRLDVSDAAICSSQHEGRQVLNETFPMHVDQLFTLLFTNSKFFLDFHASRRTSDLTQTPWVHADATGKRHRTVTLTVAIQQPIGPKSAQVTETQVMLPCSKPGQLYSIDVETVNAGIPYADSFYIVVHYCLEKVSEMETHLNAFAQVKYKKSVWSMVKGIIEKNCWAGLEEFYSSLSKALFIECEEQIHPIRKRKPKRILKDKAPGIPMESAFAKVHGSRLRVPHPPRPPQTECATWLVLVVLLLLVLLNLALYYKLWMLEEAPPYTLLDLHVLKEPPKSHEEWLKLLQQQETLHSVEMQKWQRVLKTAVQLLRQTEESLSELQHSIHPTSSNKILSILQTHKDIKGDSPSDTDRHTNRGDL